MGDPFNPPPPGRSRVKLKSLSTYAVCCSNYVGHSPSVISVPLVLKGVVCNVTQDVRRHVPKNREEEIGPLLA